MSTKPKYVHTITLTKEEENRVKEIMKKDFSFTNIFRKGLEEAEKIVNNSQNLNGKEN